MKTYVVYAFVADLVHLYVGSSKDFPRRKRDHWRDSQFCKDSPHGAFVVLESDIPKDKIKEREEYWIAECKTYENGYNRTRKYMGGQDCSTETRERIGERVKVRWEDPDFREKMSQISKERWEDPDFRGKMSQSRKDMWEDPKRREKRSEQVKEQWADPEYCEMMSQKLKEHWADPKYREKVSQSLKNAWVNPDLREEKSQWAKKQWKDPEYREMMLRERNERWDRIYLECSQLLSVLLTSKSVLESYIYRKRVREGFFDKDLPDTSKAEQGGLF